MMRLGVDAVQAGMTEGDESAESKISNGRALEKSRGKLLKVSF